MPITDEICECGHTYRMHIDTEHMTEGECSKGWDYCDCEFFKQVIKDNSNKPS